MDTLLEIFFLPPMAIARCGSSPTPVGSYRWIERAILPDAPATLIEPAVSLRVEDDGSVTPELPEEIVFRDGDGGPIRPVAPFFELWARLQGDTGEIREAPLTPALLEKMKVSLKDVSYEINAANRKVERRTGIGAHSIVARELVNGADHARRELLAFSPHTSGQEPLVFRDEPIPFGFFQALRPVEKEVLVPPNGGIAIDLGTLRVRFTPPKGLVYGPYTATTGPAQEVPPGVYEAPSAQWGRIHEIVPPERRILNWAASWSRYIMMNGSHEDPAPQDGYDGATVGNHRAWGCVDDSSDALITATLVVDGQLYKAAARVFVGPPDFAPDRRPVYSIADDIADRENPPIEVGENPDEDTAEVLDMFHRAFDASSLFNLDAERARALQENMVRLRKHGLPEGLDEPKARDESMTAKDVPYVDKIPILAPQSPSRFTDATPNAPLPYTAVVSGVHGPLKNKVVLLDFLKRQASVVRKIVRPAFGSFAQLPVTPADDPDPGFRDPRVFRDQLHDMRMPPYMRDANLQPLSLSRRQYVELMDFVDLLPARGDAGSGRQEDAGGSENDFRQRIFPRNLTARAAQAARSVVGNPVTTRLESGVGNCFPGLEFDVRTLDRRFFPGLVFNFVQPPRPEYLLKDALPDQQGAHLLYADWFFDPMLPENSPEQWVQDLLLAYKISGGGSWMGGRWYLDWIEQDGKRISTKDAKGSYYDGYTVWRFVRSLKPGKELTIGIVDRNDPKSTAEFTGQRRKYVNAAGLFDESFRPGELTNSMCNPWAHDFRDCACHYWPTNHPDVVIRRADESLADGQPEDPLAARTHVYWQRLRDRFVELPAFDTIAKNRPYELDHYQINTMWETLPFVVEGREIGSTYKPPQLPTGDPYSNVGELVKDLEDKLAPMELGLAMQYLYALFSLRAPEEVDDAEHARYPNLRGDLKAIRQFVLLVTVSEMTHLRWANQMLWELYRLDGVSLTGRSYAPVVDWTDKIEIGGMERTVSLHRLEPDVLADFISIERPAAPLPAAYARCVQTLRDRPELKNVFELATRIDGDGFDHYQNFRNVKRVLDRYAKRGDDYPYLRPVVEGSGPDALAAVDLFDSIRESIRRGYDAEAKADYSDAQKHIGAARDGMREFHAVAEALARTGQGVPLLRGRRARR